MIEEDKDYNDVDEELKRADHLIFVSLKYTRTVDVVLSVIKRLMNAQGILIDEILEWLESKKKLKNVDYSKSYLIKINRIKNSIKDSKINEFLEFYEYLLRIMKAKHIKRGEFRKNLALIVQEKNGALIEEVNVDVLKEYYKKTEKFKEKIREIIK